MLAVPTPATLPVRVAGGRGPGHPPPPPYPVCAPATCVPTTLLGVQVAEARGSRAEAALKETTAAIQERERAAAKQQVCVSRGVRMRGWVRV